MFRSLLLLIALSLGVLAQATRTPDDSAAQDTASVEGRVTNAETGDGVSGASVRLVPLGRRSTGPVRSANSQADGTFIVEGLSAGSYIVFASHPNYIPANQGQGPRSSIEVHTGETVTNVSVRLNPGRRIHGKVIDDEANPVPGARVQLFTTYNVRGKTQLRPVSEGSTDEQGKYALEAQGTGRYYIAAEPHSEQQSGEPESEKPPKDPATPGSLELVRTFYPKSLDVDNATAIDITTGQDAPDATIELRRAAAYHIRGKIEGLIFPDSGRRPTILLSLRGSVAPGVMGRVVRPQADGTFDIPSVIPRSYTLTLLGTDNSGAAESTGPARPRLLARQDVDVAADDVNGIVLAVIPLVTLSGRIRVDGLDGANLEHVRVSLLPSGATTAGALHNIPVQQDGTFQIANLSPGQYMVRIVGAPSGTYIKSVTYNHQDITTAGFDITQGGGGEIEVVLRTGTGEVDGAPQEGTQVSSTTIMILVPEPLAADVSGVLFGNAQSSGSFVIRNVPPGRYYVYAAELWSPLWQNPDFLRAIQNQGTAIDLPENGHLQVTLSIISTDQIEAVANALGLTSR
jgi:hypothetical protein